FALVDINADTVDVMRGSSIEDTNATSACNLEEDVGILISNLAISDSFARCRISEVIRIADHHVNVRVNLLSTVLVPGNVADDRRDSKATYSADSVMTEQLRCLGFAINLHLTGNCANKAASFLLFKEERCDV